MDDFDDDLGVDLTPLIDVIFMLIIFFLMTATFSAPVIDLTLPSSKTADEKKSDQGVLTVSIDAGGKLYLAKEEISTDNLEEMLKSGTYQSLAVSIDAMAPTQSLIEMADLARIYTGGSLSVNAQKLQE